MLDLGRIFTGTLPKPHRGYALGALEHWRTNGYESAYVPCAGSFSLAQVALKAGFDPKNVWASDIELYPTVLGALASGQTLESLGVTSDDPRYENQRDELSKAAFILLQMKIGQLKDDYYEGAVKAELEMNPGKYLEKLKFDLEEKRQKIEGINYQVRDLRDVIENDGDETSVMVINPPAYGADSPIPCPTNIQFESGKVWWDAGIGFPREYDTLKDRKIPFLWRRINVITDIPAREVVFAVEKSKKIDYWLCPTPELLADWGHSPVKLRQKKELKPYDAPIWTDADELTEDSQITFVGCSDRQALYYRELWVHKLGFTQGELHTLMLVDGKVFAALGFWTDHLRRINTDYLFEQFGMCARIKDDPMPTRLMMLAITSKAFRDQVIGLCGPRNRYFELNGLKTVCISKFRKVKHNTGIFTLQEREKLPNGLYKLTYYTDFRDDSYSDVVHRYLRETEEKKVHLGIR